LDLGELPFQVRARNGQSVGLDQLTLKSGQSETVVRPDLINQL